MTICTGPFIDEVTLPCTACGGLMQPCPEVIDAWYDSGAMPFAQKHYPFENKERSSTRTPRTSSAREWIRPAAGSSRCWRSRRCCSTFRRTGTASSVGTPQDKNGKKMSKSRRNTIEPDTIFDQFGADAARWYFYAQGVENAELRVSPASFQDVVRALHAHALERLLVLRDLRAHRGLRPRIGRSGGARTPALDRWCLARLAETIDGVRDAMERYDASDAVHAVEAFVEDLSKWYVRRSRRRFWKSAGTSDNFASAFATLNTVLLSLASLVAPFMPFMAERMYRNLSGFNGDPPSPAGAPDSVHLTDYPKVAGAWRDSEVIVEMSKLRRLVEDGLAARTTVGVRVRQPLASATLASTPLDPELEAIFMEELNVKSVAYVDPEGGHPSVVFDTVDHRRAPPRVAGARDQPQGERPAQAGSTPRRGSDHACSSTPTAMQRVLSVHTASGCKGETLAVSDRGPA